MDMIKKDNRLYRGNEVAVIVSPGYGAGWSSWNDKAEDLLFDADIAEAILANEYEKAIVIAGDKYPKAYLYGLEQACVKWLRKGAVFQIKVHDGYERIEEIYLPEHFTA
jgi:hypothetical protein